MRLPSYLAALAAATAGHALALRLAPALVRTFDPFLLLAVYRTLSLPGPAALLAGSAAGLSRDALTGGPYGLHGFADTAVSYAILLLQQRLVVQRPFQVGLVFALAAGFQQAVVAGLAFLLLGGVELLNVGAVAGKMVVTGALGAALWAAAAATRRRWERGRDRYRRRLGWALRPGGWTRIGGRDGR